jgi:acyl-[acyl-carrier-protein] desaturase
MKTGEINYELEKNIEVISQLDGLVADAVDNILVDPDTCWQPSDFLPDFGDPNVHEEIKLLQKRAEGIPDTVLTSLIGNMITEEALPSYQTYFNMLEGVNPERNLLSVGGWVRWSKSWTAEENRHGDALNRYLYLCGRINMREFEASTQYLIRDGFDNGASNDPYRNFIYTSFQELATNISHRRTASLAKQHGNSLLSRMCAQIAADELRHHKAYRSFVSEIFTLDPNEMMLAFADMMKKKIVMPAHFLREINGAKSSLFEHFSDAAQRLGVYTTTDYVTIMKGLIADWDIEKMSGLNETAEKARDYVANLPARLEKLADRVKVPELAYPFSWIA